MCENLLNEFERLGVKGIGTLPLGLQVEGWRGVVTTISKVYINVYGTFDVLHYG